MNQLKGVLHTSQFNSFGPVGPKGNPFTDVANSDGVRTKKVDFNLVPVIYYIEREDRKGPWETAALDRERFNQRIKKIEIEIGWCFEPSHRQKISNFYQVDSENGKNRPEY
jgi:hypothetical protein